MVRESTDLDDHPLIPPEEVHQQRLRLAHDLAPRHPDHLETAGSQPFIPQTISYRRANKRNKNHPWIECLRITDPVSHAGTLWSEIHFTVPQAVLVQANLRPHVTCISSADGR